MTKKITLTAGGARAGVTIAGAQEMLDGFERTVNRYDDAVVHTLNLSCKQWPRESLEVLRPFFVRIAPHVEILKIDDIIAGLPTTEQGLATLAFFSEVFSESPVMELVLDDNALGTRGITVLQPLLQAPTLQRLYLDNTGLSEQVMTDLSLALQPVAANLTAVSLGRNQIGPVGAGILAATLQQCVKLQYFSYHGSRPLSGGTLVLCQGLAILTETNHGLVYLNLDDCTFGTGEGEDDAVFCLAEILSRSPALTTLIVRDGELQVPGVRKVLNALIESKAVLHHLDLGCNELGPECAEIVGAFLTTQVFTLHTLIMDINELGDGGLADLVAPFTGRSSVLQHLNLDQNEIETVGARVLVDNPISSLRELKLEENDDIPAQAAAALNEMYATVLVEEALTDADDWEDVGEDADADVDAMADAMAGRLLL